MSLAVAFSGGKDSTAMALHLAEIGANFQLVYTATGNELPPVDKHIVKVAEMTGAPLIRVPAPTLAQLIDEQQCLPNHRMRWCTRLIKIEPMARWLADNSDTVLAVGLRADEESRAGGTYAATEIVYPLREWSWGLAEVLRCCDRHKVDVPPRTDCAVCFFQTLYEWYLLWRDYPAHYLQGIKWEERIGYTFRSPSRDTQPAALSQLATKFAGGYTPKPRRRKVSCRVCAM